MKAGSEVSRAFGLWCESSFSEILDIFLIGGQYTTLWRGSRGLGGHEEVIAARSSTEDARWASPEAAGQQPSWRPRSGGCD